MGRGCINFWLDDPLEALENIRSIIPRENQCINEKLNGLSLFVILFTIVLALANVKLFWVFGLIGLLIVIAIKLIWFSGTKGERSVEEYMTGYDDSEISQSIYQSEEMEEPGYYAPIYEDDLAIRPQLANYGETWDEIKMNVADQISWARMPGIENCPYNEDNCYY